MRKSYENGIDPRDTKVAPSSMTEAAEKYLNCYNVKLEKKILEGWNVFRELGRPIITKERYDRKH